MNRILLPQSDIEISQAVFGTSRLGGTIERYDKGEALAVLRTALEGGLNCFDTADIYGQGNGERLLGEAFRKNRDEVVIATKGGYALSGKGQLLARIKPLVRRLLKNRPGLVKAAVKTRSAQMRQDFSPAHLTAAVEASLKRLRTDRIDLYQLHSPDPATLASGEVFEVLNDLKATGKIRAYGASLLRWQDAAHCFGRGLSWIQVDGGILAGTPAASFCQQCREAGISVIARQAFGSGLLSRDPDSWTADDFAGDLNAMAAARERTRQLRQTGDPFSALLRHLTHHSPFDGFLLATTRLTHLRTNLAALAQTPFSPKEAAILPSLLYVS
jgi:aryl-alcohol dehydrogenase-like predicted oxidoreductase